MWCNFFDDGTNNEDLFYDYLRSLQWGSASETSLVFEWSKRGQMPNGPGPGPVFKGYLNTGQPDHFARWPQMHHSVS